MYYKLKPQYLLRGWDLLPTGIINRETGAFAFLPPELYQVLRRCNGMLRAESPLFTPQQRLDMEKLRKMDLVEVREQPSALEPRQVYKKYNNRFLHTAQLSITGKCNCHCRHCYMSATEAALGELSHDQCLDIIDQLAECGVQSVALTGGEPLVRKDFWQLVDHLLAQDIQVDSIMTNGLLVDANFLQKLKKRGMHNTAIVISFDGIGHHDWLRGMPGLEQKVLSDFALCHQQGFKTRALFCLYKDNMKSLGETVSKLGALGVSNLHVSRLSIEGNALQIREQAISREQEYQTYLDFLPEYIKTGVVMPVQLSGFFAAYDKTGYYIPQVKLPEKQEVDDCCLCGSARDGVHITADGRITPCPPLGNLHSAHLQFPNFASARLRDALTASTYLKFITAQVGEYFAKNAQCAACEYRNRCAGGCRGRAFMDAGEKNFWEIDQDACHFFKDGWYERLTKLMEQLQVKLLTAV